MRLRLKINVNPNAKHPKDRHTVNFHTCAMADHRPRCRWHRRRLATVVGLKSKLGYCRECWPHDKRLPPRLDPNNIHDATIWLAA